MSCATSAVLRRFDGSQRVILSRCVAAGTASMLAVHESRLRRQVYVDRYRGGCDDFGRTVWRAGMGHTDLHEVNL